MKEFIAAKGWNYAGTCGCTPRGDNYTSGGHPGYEIRLYSSTFVIRFRNPIAKTISSGRADELEAKYNAVFP